MAVIKVKNLTKDYGFGRGVFDVSFVAANMSDPHVLVLDEPTSGVDPVMQENFINFNKT